MKIQNNGLRYHTKASEKYVDVTFCYEEKPPYITSIPIEYRRTGTEIEDVDIDKYLHQVYEEIAPQNWDTWRLEQQAFWLSKPKAGVTLGFFDALASKFEWCCVTCTLPQNPNWARRIQDIKEFGYTLATHTKRHCGTCDKNTTQIILVPLKRGGITGYETWSPLLRNNIMDILDNFDSYEAKTGKKEGLLPDHKFPEIRWDTNTKRESLDHLSPDDVKRDFQLLTNQRNQQKREVCRKCFQTGERGVLYGIPFFYAGTQQWDDNIPKTGKLAENGCIGCAWYDINRWRNQLIQCLNLTSKK